jgi:hypothetical protein
MADHGTEPVSGSKSDVYDAPTITHAESNQAQTKWKSVKNADGDTAMALFDDPAELHEPVDPAEARRILRKIDLMILPYLAVCYAFFYIDKVGKSTPDRNQSPLL